MAFQAARSFLPGIVEMVVPASVFFGQVAAVAKGIIMYKDFTAVWFMTILADHSLMIHFTLKKGSIYIYLLQDLPVCKIESLVQQGGNMRVQQ
jgi:hypothetical protein